MIIIDEEGRKIHTKIVRLNSCIERTHHQKRRKSSQPRVNIVY